MKEHDRVVLRADLPANRLQAGDVGTIIHVYPGANACEVEFVELNGSTLAVATVRLENIRPVRDGEIAHARFVAMA